MLHLSFPYASLPLDLISRVLSLLYISFLCCCCCKESSLLLAGLPAASREAGPAIAVYTAASQVEAAASTARCYKRLREMMLEQGDAAASGLAGLQGRENAWRPLLPTDVPPESKKCGVATGTHTAASLADATARWRGGVGGGVGSTTWSVASVGATSGLTGDARQGTHVTTTAKRGHRVLRATMPSVANGLANAMTRGMRVMTMAVTASG